MIKNVVCNKADRIDPNELSGVYEITFIKNDGRMQYYIGLADWNLKTRIIEYIADMKYHKRITTMVNKGETTKNSYRLIKKK